MRSPLMTIFILLASTYLLSCESETYEFYPGSCGTLATVEDWSELDGCGYLFRLDNGEYLEGFMPLICGTPPLPEEYLNNPLREFVFEHGKRVRIDYELAEAASICMKGSMATITCIEEIDEPVSNN